MRDSGDSESRINDREGTTSAESMENESKVNISQADIYSIASDTQYLDK